MRPATNVDDGDELAQYLAAYAAQTQELLKKPNPLTLIRAALAAGEELMERSVWCHRIGLCAATDFHLDDRSWYVFNRMVELLGAVYPDMVAHMRDLEPRRQQVQHQREGLRHPTERRVRSRKTRSR